MVDVLQVFSPSNSIGRALGFDCSHFMYVIERLQRDGIFHKKTLVINGG